MSCSVSLGMDWLQRPTHSHSPLRRPSCVTCPCHHPRTHLPLLFYLAAAIIEFIGDFFVILLAILVKVVLIEPPGPELFYLK